MSLCDGTGVLQLSLLQYKTRRVVVVGIGCQLVVSPMYTSCLSSLPWTGISTSKTRKQLSSLHQCEHGPHLNAGV